MDFPSGSDSKVSACSAGDPGSIPGSGRSPGDGNGNPLQYSCLENSVDRRAWQVTVHAVTQNQTWLTNTFSFILIQLIHIWILYWRIATSFFFLSRILSSLFFPFIFISWWLIMFQDFSGFCHTLTWISHGFTCVPHPDPPSHLPPHPIPLGHPSAPALSTCLMHPAWAGDLFHTW